MDKLSQLKLLTIRLKINEQICRSLESKFHEVIRTKVIEHLTEEERKGLLDLMQLYAINSDLTNRILRLRRALSMKPEGDIYEYTGGYN